MTPERRAHVVVTGRVQGVFFRASCVREASARGLAGWVRNRRDGSLEAAFEGDPDAVAALVRWCRAGPPGASVDDVDVRDEAPTGERGFRVTG
jgi:acylphosphatase